MRKIMPDFIRLIRVAWNNKKRAVNHIEMRMGRPRLFSGPRKLQIETTNRCNLNCVMCARPYYDKKKNVLGDMTMETFKRLVPYIKKSEQVYLFGYGEPLIARNFWAILDICRNLGVKTRFTTNGTMLTAETSARLLTAGVDTITVSLDASSEGLFRSLRGYSLKKIVDNLLSLKKLKRDAGVSKPIVNISFVLMKDNIRELPGMVDLAKEAGVRSIGVGHVKIYTRSLEEQSAFHAVAEAKEVFNEAAQRARREKIHLSLPGLDHGTKYCVQPFDSLFIHWDGRVRPCCSAAFVSEEFDFIVGDVEREDLGNIWNNEQMIRIRKGLLGKGKIMPQCLNCAFRIRDIQAHRRYLN